MEKIKVLIAGLPGKMSSEVVKALGEHSDEFSIIPTSYTGPEIHETQFLVAGYPKSFLLMKPNLREEDIQNIKDIYGQFIAVDFTQPDAVLGNVEFYCRHDIPFIMGTTGGDRSKLEEQVKNSSIPALAAPNMAKEIVGLQLLLEDFSAKYPDALRGVLCAVQESHQAGKKDTSGTAKAVVQYINQLGIPYAKEGVEASSLLDIDAITMQRKIAMIRSPEMQRAIGVPEAFLKGHAWHTYTFLSQKGERHSMIELLKQKLLTYLQSDVFNGYREIHSESVLEKVSSDGNILFAVGHLGINYGLSITHNVNGRSIYANGSLDALRYLQEKINAGEKGKLFTMINMLQGK